MLERSQLELKRLDGALQDRSAQLAGAQEAHSAEVAQLRADLGAAMAYRLECYKRKMRIAELQKQLQAAGLADGSMESGPDSQDSAGWISSQHACEGV